MLRFSTWHTVDMPTSYRRRERCHPRILRGKNVTPLFPNPRPGKRLLFGEIRPAWSKTAVFFQCRRRGHIFNTLCIRLKLCISPLYKYYKIILTLHSTNSVLFACISFKLGNSDEGYQARSKTGLLFNLRSTLTELHGSICCSFLYLQSTKTERFA